MTSPSILAVPTQHEQNCGIIPPNAHYGGLTYGEWMAKMWQWSYSIPASQNPVLFGNEAFIATEQPKQLWFLGGVGGPAVSETHFVVPAGTALFVTIIICEWDNFLCVEPDSDYSIDELRDIAKSCVDAATDIHVEVDGFPVRDVAQYRTTSPVFSSVLPDGNLLQAIGCTDALPGIYGPMVADGYALILAPLSVGEHTIHESFLIGSNPVDVTWKISVVAGNE